MYYTLTTHKIIFITFILSFIYYMLKLV